jgi:predicted PurR-regulated permease PerM
MARMSNAMFLNRVLMLTAVAIAAVVIWYLFDVVLIALGALILAILLRLGAEPFMRWLRVPESIALAMSVVLLTVAVGGAGYLFGARMAGELQNVLDRATAAEASITASLQASQWGKLILTHVKGTNFSLSEIVGGLFTKGTTFLGAVVVLIITGIYFAAQPELYRAGIIHLFPPEFHAKVAGTLDALANALRFWLIGRLIQMVLIGLLSTFAVWLIGLPSPFALGLIAGMAEFVPYLGPILASIPAILVAATQDAAAVIWTIVAYLLIHQLEGNVFVPLIQHRMVYIPPAVILLGIVTISFLFGMISMIFAAPITIMIVGSDRRSSLIAPASCNAAHRIGAACPFDSTNASALRVAGSFGAQRISRKNSAATISAQDMQDVGCPDPASVVMRITSRRSLRVAACKRSRPGSRRCDRAWRRAA